MQSNHPLFKLKTNLFLEVGLWTVFPYFILQHFPLFKPFTMPFLFIDNWFPFSAHFIWVYQSLYLLIIWRTFTFNSLELLIRFAKTFSVAVFFSVLFFLFFPTQCTRPVLNDADLLYAFFVQFEKPLNAFPSMHVSLVLVTCNFAFKDAYFNSVNRVLIVLWTLGVIVSTLYTKQHVFIDVLGGFVVWIMAMKIGSKKAFLGFIERRWLLFYQNQIKKNETVLPK